MEYAFTCKCKCLFARYIKDGEPVEVNCPLCGENTTDAIPMQYGRVKPNLTVIQDIEPYKSPLDGSVISSRSRHREHMREHGVIEMGNEYPKGKEVDRAPMSRAGHDIARSLEGGR